MSATVVIRAKNEAGAIGRTLELVAGQTVDAQIVVVDSGSSDDTVAIARRAGAEVVEIPAASFTYVGNLYPPHDQGGGYEAVWHGANEALRANGHEVRVLTTDHLVARREDRPGADVHRELRWYSGDHEFPKRPLRDVVALERHNAAVLRQHLDRVDLVAWWSMGGMSLSLFEIARRARIPAVAFVHDDWTCASPWRAAAGGPLHRAVKAALVA